MPRKGSEIVDVRYDRIKIDDDRHKSILFQFSEKEVWLPRSLIEVNIDDKTVTMPVWKAEQEGIEGYVV